MRRPRHVVIADNGAGKSSFLRALVGPTEAPGLREDWSNRLRQGKKNASIML